MTLYEIKYAELHTKLLHVECDCDKPDCKNKGNIKRLVLFHKVKKAIVRTTISFNTLKNLLEDGGDIKEPLNIINNELVIKGKTDAVKTNDEKEEFQLCRPKMILIDFKKIK
jgi:hypothetical protein